MKLAYSSKAKGAKAMGRDFHVSYKVAREVAGAIRGMKVSTAKSLLEAVARKEKPIYYKRFKRKVAHRKGGMSGRYPVKAANLFLKMLANAESNAKDMDNDKLVVSHISVGQGRPIIGRRKGSTWNTQTSHVQVILAEAA